MKIDYTKLTFSELINKIEINRFFDLPRMVKEAFSRLSEKVDDISSSSIESITGDFVDNTDPSNPVLDRGYKVYTATISQTGLADPVITTLFENTIGDIVWQRIAQGQYQGVLENAFFNNTYTQIKPSYDSAEDVVFGIKKDDRDSVVISSSLLTTLLPTDSLLNNIDFEIRVYN